MKIIHYAVVLIWVIGNSVWALGDLFVDNYNDPLVLWTRLVSSYFVVVVIVIDPFYSILLFLLFVIVVVMTRSEDSLKTARWYSSWILLADLVPVVIIVIIIY